MPTRDPKTTYAQSGDIKARTYLQYRFDMKRKAIAELEALLWLAKVLRAHFQRPVRLEKSGGDAFLWFLRSGGITREPDYRAYIALPNGQSTLREIEFQYAEHVNLRYYDFKVSKVRRKRKDSIEPRPTLFAYIHKPLQQYALLEAAWIMQHGEEGVVPAWGNRKAYRVPASIFEAQLRSDPALPDLIQRIDQKSALLYFQHRQLERWKSQLQRELEQVIDEQHMMQWRPQDLKTFFRVMFVLQHLDRTPTQAPLWLVYATTYAPQLQTLQQSAQLAYILDALYGHIPAPSLKPNEQQAFAQALEQLSGFVLRHAQPNGAFVSDPTTPMVQETRYALFALNLIEDMVQDFWFYYADSPHKPLQPIQRIWEWLPSVEQTWTFLQPYLHT